MAKSSQLFALFVDINNFYHGAIKKYRARLDYKHFIEEIKEKYGKLQIAYAYGIASDSSFESFKALLRHAGYECRWGGPKYNWNVGIAMDVMRQIDKVDLIILGSGDPYLAPCAEYVRQQGIKCYSYGFRISSEMRKAVDRYFEIPESFLVDENNDYDYEDIE